MPSPVKASAERLGTWGPHVYEKTVAAWITALLLGGLAPGVQAGADTSPLQRPALKLPTPQAAAMLGLATAGARLVAVGERGVVLLSDDRGKTWRQAEVPVSVTLTSVRFVDAQHGFATGHSGVVLATKDGGEHWVRVLDGKTAADLALAAAQAMEQRLGADDATAKRAMIVARRLVADGPDKPLLDLYFADPQRGFVVGAYGLAFMTGDGGKTWTSLLDRIDNPKGLHLNAIGGSGAHVVIAGEQGLLLRSGDGGMQFARVETPYRGSWFALDVGPAGQTLLGGLRGNAYFSDGPGGSWSKVEFAAPVSITSLARAQDGRVYAGNQAGQVYVSRDGGRSFQVTAVKAEAPLAALVSDAQGFVFAGLRGVQRVDAQVKDDKGTRP
jgi:photosystem II stability/assembly factor-like uncharacterized protein